jgi:hypothetical protein
MRVTLPHLLHGAYGPAKGERRSMLPRFYDLQNDLETLQVFESSTWSDPSIIHRDMVAARLSFWPGQSLWGYSFYFSCLCSIGRPQGSSRRAGLLATP